MKVAIAGGGKYMVSVEAVLHYSENGNVFRDVLPKDWYYATIDQMATLGLMSGVGQDAYAPNGDTSRAMLATLLYRCSGEQLDEGWERTNTFTDVEDDIWYSEAIEWAYRNQVVKGYPDNTFRHEQSITRQEMAQMFMNYLLYQGEELDTETDSSKSFKDGDQIADWALAAVNAIANKGLMVGDTNSNFNPDKTATRAETATVLVRMMGEE